MTDQPQNSDKPNPDVEAPPHVILAEGKRPVHETEHYTIQEHPAYRSSWLDRLRYYCGLLFWGLLLCGALVTICALLR
ncbi:hypothetical protein ACFL2Q_01020 [Thermodesulfobacteriota bacterium]